MMMPIHSPFTQWYCEGQKAEYVRTTKSPGGILTLLDLARPAGDMSRPALPELVLHQDLIGGGRVRADLGGGPFEVTSRKGYFYLDTPNVANTVSVSASHRLRSLSFPVAPWKGIVHDASEGTSSLEGLQLYRGPVQAPAIQSAMQKLWTLCEDEGAPSRLLAQAAGCEILAELSRLSGAPFQSAKGGLSPWVMRRCVELMHGRLSEDIGLDELAAEARLSVFHFARMFKQSFGVPPRVYLTQLRIEKACELLKLTDMPVTEIAFEVGYSSNQVLARVFTRHRRLSPSGFRRAAR